MINHHDVYLIFYVKINLEVMSVKKEQQNRIWAPEQKAEIACNHLFEQCCNGKLLRDIKAEPLYIQDLYSLEHFKAELIDYLVYYSNHRIKAKLKGLTPAQHRSQTL